MENSLDSQKQTLEQEQTKKQRRKQQQQDKSDLGEHFIAPDGGLWAWLVCIAAGLSNVSSYFS